jgi:hypothetical protein
MATRRRTAPDKGRFVKIGALIALPVIVASVGALVMGEALKEARIGADYCYASSAPRKMRRSSSMSVSRRTPARRRTAI